MYAVTELEITKRMNKNYIGIREQRHQNFLISTLNMRAATLLNTVKISYVCVCVFLGVWSKVGTVLVVALTYT